MESPSVCSAYLRDVGEAKEIVISTCYSFFYLLYSWYQRLGEESIFEFQRAETLKGSMEESLPNLNLRFWLPTSGFLESRSTKEWGKLRSFLLSGVCVLWVRDVSAPAEQRSPGS